MIKSNYDVIIEQYESIYNEEVKDGYHKYYNLKEISELKKISYKSCKNMVQTIHLKNRDDGTIFKKGKKYCISHKLLDQFELKQRRVNSDYTAYSYPWQSNISWTTKDYYSEAYHIQIFNTLREKTPDIGCVEVDTSGRNHVHLLSNGDPQHLKPILASLLDDYLDDDRYYRLYCETVINRGASVEYLKKNPLRLINNTTFKFL